MNSRWDRFLPADAWEAWAPGAGSGDDFAAVNHLHRRGAFGASWGQIERDVARDYHEAVRGLLDGAGSSADHSVEDGVSATIAAGGNSRDLAAAWLLRMCNSKHAAVEKATLFWHGHFATSASKVGESRLMDAQNKLLRNLALGDFLPLAQAISRDPAMLIYLDSRESKKSRPNENFARELMELFCLGTGNYSEQDIRELARCFSGWEVRYGRFRFNRFQHVNETKTFLGLSGNFTGEEAVAAVVGHQATARFLTGKLLRFYVADDFPLDSPLVDALADQFRKHDLNMRWFLEKVFSSRLFQSPECRGACIRSPVDFAVGFIRSAGIQVSMKNLVDPLEGLGQLPFYPPSVKGWDGGLAWINAQRLLGRSNLMDQIAGEADERMFSGSPVFDPKEPREIVRRIAKLTMAVPLPESSIELLADIAKRQSGGNGARLRAILPVLAFLPEFQAG